MAFDSRGNLYLATGDHGDNRVRQPRFCGDLGDTGERRDNDDSFNARSRQSLNRPLQHGLPEQVRSQLVAAAHPAAGAGSNDDRLQVGARRGTRARSRAFRLNSGTHSE